MTQRLPFYVSASLLAHMAVLLVWRAAPVHPPTLTEHRLQISLVQTVPQTSTSLAAGVHAPNTPLTEHNSTSGRSLIKARPALRPRYAPVSRPAPPVTATPTALTDVATATTIQTHAPNLSADTVARLQTELHIAFNRYFSYPAMALRHGWKGVVKLSLCLEPDGRLSDVHLIQSSGYSSLDAAALATAQQIPPLLEAVTWLQGNSHVILLPVEYRLIDG